MNWYEKYSQTIKKYQFIGTCISTVDDSCIWDATEMAQIIENSSSYDVMNILPFIDIKLKNSIIKNMQNFECGINNEIVWIYDINKDLHYFYEEIK